MLFDREVLPVEMHQALAGYFAPLPLTRPIFMGDNNEASL